MPAGNHNIQCQNWCIAVFVLLLNITLQHVAVVGIDWIRWYSLASRLLEMLWNGSVHNSGAEMQKSILRLEKILDSTQ